MVWRGRFGSVQALREMVEEAHRKPSRLGGEREGVVIRLARAFHETEFEDAVCKSVRENHVQTDEHWTRNWKPCRLARA